MIVPYPNAYIQLSLSIAEKVVPGPLIDIKMGRH